MANKRLAAYRDAVLAVGGGLSVALGTALVAHALQFLPLSPTIALVGGTALAMGLMFGGHWVFQQLYRRFEGKVNPSDSQAREQAHLLIWAVFVVSLLASLAMWALEPILMLVSGYWVVILGAGLACIAIVLLAAFIPIVRLQSSHSPDVKLKDLQKMGRVDLFIGLSPPSPQSGFPEEAGVWPGDSGFAQEIRRTAQMGIEDGQTAFDYFDKTFKEGLLGGEPAGAFCSYPVPRRKSPWWLMLKVITQEFWTGATKSCIYLVPSSETKKHVRPFLETLSLVVGRFHVHCMADGTQRVYDRGVTTDAWDDPVERLVVVLSDVNIKDPDKIETALKELEPAVSIAKSAFGGYQCAMVLDLTFSTAMFSSVMPRSAYNYPVRVLGYATLKGKGSEVRYDCRQLRATSSSARVS